MGNYFRELAYSLGDEDSRVERDILPRRAKRVLAIAGSGGRVVPLLAQAPERLEAVDISPEQAAFTRFRLAALATLDVEGYTRLLGYGSMPLLAEHRCNLIAALPFSTADKEMMWRLHRSHPETPLAYTGKFEQTLRRFSTIIRFVLGDRIRELFEITELTDQRSFFKTRFPHRRWKLLVRLLGNATLLNAVLYKGDFPRKNRAESHFRIYDDIFRSLFERVLARESFFLQMLMLGEVAYAEGLPVECDPETYAQARSALERTRLEVRVGDITEVSKEFASGIDFVSLSDVPSFLNSGAESNTYASFAPHMSPGGRIVVRSHLRKLPPVASPLRDVTASFSDVIASESTNLWRIAVAERPEGQ